MYFRLKLWIRFCPKQWDFQILSLIIFCVVVRFIILLMSIGQKCVFSVKYFGFDIYCVCLWVYAIFVLQPPLSAVMECRFGWSSRPLSIQLRSPTVLWDLALSSSLRGHESMSSIQKSEYAQHRDSYQWRPPQEFSSPKSCGDSCSADKLQQHSPQPIGIKAVLDHATSILLHL